MPGKWPVVATFIGHLYKRQTPARLPRPRTPRLHRLSRRYLHTKSLHVCLHNGARHRSNWARLRNQFLAWMHSFHLSLPTLIPCHSLGCLMDAHIFWTLCHHLLSTSLLLSGPAMKMTGVACALSIQRRLNHYGRPLVCRVHALVR